ncbi:hypothetical protein LEP1GSC016_0012 [Leptospira borgpetersenii serovar Hardjo-bovis str. Sponselee]|uniref:Uncharacterized protein n=1 Tax=Leptospira borgpetersenii serovar Hardjo-bovis str. Sponselee TaxID=1303729 RepID=M6BG30_LEPBO|nr:hypothetical protein LEP1GSC016_0012 [Leptospira borgpetersenii serovar Hardjo-bovis str. Sponselee]
MRKNFLKARIPTISEFVRKIMICSNYRILRINLQSSNSNFLQKNESWSSYAELTFIQ